MQNKRRIVVIAVVIGCILGIVVFLLTGLKGYMSADEELLNENVQWNSYESVKDSVFDSDIGEYINISENDYNEDTVNDALMNAYYKKSEYNIVNFAGVTETSLLDSAIKFHGDAELVSSDFTEDEKKIVVKDVEKGFIYEECVKLSAETIEPVHYNREPLNVTSNHEELYMQEDDWGDSTESKVVYRARLTSNFDTVFMAMFEEENADLFDEIRDKGIEILRSDYMSERDELEFWTGIEETRKRVLYTLRYKPFIEDAVTPEELSEYVDKIAALAKDYDSRYYWQLGGMGIVGVIDVTPVACVYVNGERIGSLDNVFVSDEDTFSVRLFNGIGNITEYRKKWPARWYEWAHGVVEDSIGFDGEEIIGTEAMIDRATDYFGSAKFLREHVKMDSDDVTKSKTKTIFLKDDEYGFEYEYTVELDYNTIDFPDLEGDIGVAINEYLNSTFDECYFDLFEKKNAGLFLDMEKEGITCIHTNMDRIDFFGNPNIADVSVLYILDGDSSTHNLETLKSYAERLAMYIKDYDTRIYWSRRIECRLDGEIVGYVSLVQR